MTIEALKQRREQVQVALQQNHYTMQGHLNELDFQIEQLTKAQQAEIQEASNAVMDSADENTSQTDVNPS